MLKDLGVDIRKNTESDKAVLEVRTDASAGRGIAVQGKSLEYRTWQILEPNTLTEDQFEEHSRGVTVTVVNQGLEQSCGQNCEKFARPHPEEIPVCDSYEVDTQSETRNIRPALSVWFFACHFFH